MCKMLRKNISINKEDYGIINSYIKKTGQSFSDFLCTAAIKYIERQNQTNLLTYLNDNCSYISKKEQKEIDSMNIDYSNIAG